MIGKKIFSAIYMVISIFFIYRNVIPFIQTIWNAQNRGDGISTIAYIMCIGFNISMIFTCICSLVIMLRHDEGPFQTIFTNTTIRILGIGFEMAINLIPLIIFNQYYDNNLIVLFSIILYVAILIWKIGTAAASIEDGDIRYEVSGFYWNLHKYLVGRARYKETIKIAESNYKIFLEQSKF